MNAETLVLAVAGSTPAETFGFWFHALLLPTKKGEGIVASLHNLLAYPSILQISIHNGCPNPHVVKFGTGEFLGR